MIKTKEAIKMLHRAGAVLKRQTGSHQMWEAPSRQVFVLPYSGSHLEVSKHVRCGLEKFIAAECA